MLSANRTSAIRILKQFFVSSVLSFTFRAYCAQEPSEIQSKSAATVDPPLADEQNDELSEFKLFVGQVPRSFTEAELFPIFQAFGEIVELAILRDRGISGTSKGTRVLHA